VIPPTIEIRNRAKRTAFFTKVDQEVKNVKQRAKKHGAETLNALSQSLCIPLRNTVRLYERTLKNLHPFEQVVAELTVSNRQKKDGVELHTVLLELHEARKMVLDATKDWIAKVKDAPTAREADNIRKEGTEALLQLFTTVADAPISNLVELQKALRNAPIVQLNVPTMVLVGYPNVGKSSIVRALTTATNIEVSDYPFTTRGLTIGHYDICWQDQHQQQQQQQQQQQNNNSHGFAIPYDEAIHPAIPHRCQVMDSPGVLNRDDRNAMELLTVAAMQHLPTAVCFVVDLTNAETVMDQLAVRKTLRERFPKRPWLDVATKADIAFDPVGASEWQQLCHDQGIIVSIEQHIGVEQLSADVADCLGQVQLVLAAMTARKDNGE
jgi:nucleolar GTP-binding protein